jgi:RND family efflux transporter MFP subunit
LVEKFMSPQNESSPHRFDPDQMRKNLKRAAIIAGCLLGVIVVIGAYTRFSQASSVASWTRQDDIPTVALISPVPSGKNQSLTFPGTLQAFYDAPIYSRVPGYVHAWYKDIGAHVTKGEVLATIDTPELDQQILQARADLAAAQSNEKLSSVTADRWNSLLPLDAVSKQDVEDKNADLAAKTGAAKAAEARLDQLQAMKSFAQITAPFDGVVTKRTVDIGALVNAGSPSASSSSEPLFAVSDIHELRLYVNVPQTYSSEIVPGMNVTLSVPEYPGRTFPATLVSTSNAISAQSTLLVEFRADNAQGLLKPGDYAQVNIGLPGTGSQLHLPASALMFRAAGLQVATLGPGNRIVMKPITIGTDLGTQVIVASGLSPNDKVVNNPLDSFGNGDLVQVEGHAE